MEQVKMTHYSHGSGCGCKIAPKVLEEILAVDGELPQFADLLIGNDKKDDAAVYDLGNGEAIISTTDFFMPIVDDPAKFGKIAAINAMSDVYAMGGEPMMSIAILGWPIDKLPVSVAKQVVDGAREACAEAGIPLAGGHSIDSPEPIFGLAVTGRVKKEHLKSNSTAKSGDLLYLTKPLGVGIITTAQKKGLVTPEHIALAENSMLTLNKVGAAFGKLDSVHALTDVTGFGLLGHLIEMSEGSGLTATIQFDKVPVIDLGILKPYISQKSMPGGTQRNFDSYGQKVSLITDLQKSILCDPQTSGGLLVAVDPDQRDEFEAMAKAEGLNIQPFGAMKALTDHFVEVGA